MIRSNDNYCKYWGKLALEISHAEWIQEGISFSIRLALLLLLSIALSGVALASGSYGGHDGHRDRVCDPTGVYYQSDATYLLSIGQLPKKGRYSVEFEPMYLPEAFEGVIGSNFDGVMVRNSDGSYTIRVISLFGFGAEFPHNPMTTDALEGAATFSRKCRKIDITWEYVFYLWPTIPLEESEKPPRPFVDTPDSEPTIIIETYFKMQEPKRR